MGAPQIETDMRRNTLARICGAIVFLDIVYMLYAGGTNTTWTIFFVFLVLAILFNAIDEKDSEIEMLRTPKNTVEEKKRWEAHLKELADTDPRSNDPFYVSNAHNPNRQKLTRDGNVDGDGNVKKQSSTKL